MRKALSVLGDVLLLLAGLLGAGLLVLRLIGVQFFAVQTGSMGKTYPVGSLVIVYDCEPEQIETGDVITYLLDEKTQTYVTHRVISIDANDRYFVTQGDANNTPDNRTVSFSSFLGKVLGCIPGAGYPLLWFGAAGKWIFVGAVALLGMLGVLLGIRRHKKTQEENDAQQET